MKIVKNMTVHYVKHLCVQNWRQILAEYVNQLKMKSGLSFDEIADLSKRYGQGISKTTVWNLVNKPDQDVSVETLLALSKVFGIKEQELFGRIVDLPTDQTTDDETAIGCSYLRTMSPDAKADAVAILETLWRRHAVGRDSIKVPVAEANQIDKKIEKPTKKIKSAK